LPRRIQVTRRGQCKVVASTYGYAIVQRRNTIDCLQIGNVGVPARPVIGEVGAAEDAIDQIGAVDLI